MREFSRLGDEGTLDDYLRANAANLQRAGITVTLSGDTPEAQAATFLEVLLAHRIVRAMPDHADSDRCRSTKGGPQCAD
jgi:hypothetical protein